MAVVLAIARQYAVQDAFRGVLRVQPDNALALGNLAGVFFDQGKLELAVLAYQQAIHMQPVFPEAYNNLGNTLRELGRSDEAIACYTACIQLQYMQPAPAGTEASQVAALQVRRCSCCTIVSFSVFRVSCDAHISSLVMLMTDCFSVACCATASDLQCLCACSWFQDARTPHECVLSCRRSGWRWLSATWGAS